MRIFIVAILFITAVQANGGNNSIEMDYTTDLGLMGNGVEIKGNINIVNTKIFAGDIALGGTYYSYSMNTFYDSTLQNIDVTATGTDLNLYFDTRLNITDNFHWITSIYIGWMMWHFTGSATNSTYSISDTDDSYYHYFDYGTKLGVGYTLSDNWGIQFLVYKSLRNILEPLSLLSHLGGSEDAPTRVQLGVRYLF